MGGAVQVEAVEQVVGVSVALPQRRQAVTGLDHLQDRDCVIERVIHEAAPGELTTVPRRSWRNMTVQL